LSAHPFAGYRREQYCGIYFLFFPLQHDFSGGRSKIVLDLKTLVPLSLQIDPQLRTRVGASEAFPSTRLTPRRCGGIGRFIRLSPQIGPDWMQQMMHPVRAAFFSSIFFHGISME